MIKYFASDDIFACFKWIWKKEKHIFEREFAEYIGAKYAIGTSYGRTALYLGLRAIGVSEKEVIMPAFICTVVKHAVEMAGAIPQFVDFDIERFDFDIADLRRKISPKTGAIILVHYFGSVARNMDEVIQVAREHNIILIEDCAHSLGAECREKKIGTFGDFSIFSLTKNMVNFGGGFLVTNNDMICQKARDIMKNERRGLKTRIIDFPLTLAYGLEQMISKLMFDRVGNHKWWLMNLPRLIVNFRQYFLNSRKLLVQFIKFKKSKKSRVTVSNEKKKLQSGYFVDMEPIIVSLGRNQFKKIDALIAQRKAAQDVLVKCTNSIVCRNEANDAKFVYTAIVLRFKGKNIFDIIEKCKKKGILLKATWPTRQELRKNQVTENLGVIKNETLIWNINPGLTKQEIENFRNIINTLDNPTHCCEKTESYYNVTCQSQPSMSSSIQGAETKEFYQEEN